MVRLRLKYALTITVVVLSGCGPQSDRLAISGKITLNGAPLDSGSIRFTSVAGQKLFASGAVVENGEFDIPQEKGLPPGTYQLEISARTLMRRRLFTAARPASRHYRRPPRSEFRPNTTRIASTQLKSRQMVTIISCLILSTSR